MEQYKVADSCLDSKLHMKKNQCFKKGQNPFYILYRKRYRYVRKHNPVFEDSRRVLPELYHLSNHFLNAGAFSLLISTSVFKGALSVTVSFWFS